MVSFFNGLVPHNGQRYICHDYFRLLSNLIKNCNTIVETFIDRFFYSLFGLSSYFFCKQSFNDRSLIAPVSYLLAIRNKMQFTHLSTQRLVSHVVRGCNSTGLQLRLVNFDYRVSWSNEVRTYVDVSLHRVSYLKKIFPTDTSSISVPTLGFCVVSIRNL